MWSPDYIAQRGVEEQVGEMIVIRWNGKTRVYTGWREWLLVAAALAICWLVLALIAFVFMGVALTIGIMLLLAVPAAIVVAAASAMMRR